MTGKSSCGTNHLWRHLDRCNSYTSKHKQSLLNFASGSAKATWNFSQKTLRDLLTKMVIFHEYPFTIISHKIFHTFISSLQPKFQLYSRTTLKSNVMAMYELMKNFFLKKLRLWITSLWPQISGPGQIKHLLWWLQLTSSPPTGHLTSVSFPSKNYQLHILAWR